MRPDRFRLRLVPLVESNTEVAAESTSRFDSPIQDSQLRKGEVRAVVTFNLLRLWYAALHSITLLATIGCSLTNLDSSCVPFLPASLKLQYPWSLTTILSAFLVYPHASVSLCSPHPPWQGCWVIRQHQPSSVSVKWRRLWSDGGWHVSSHRAWMFSTKTSHNAFKQGLIPPALQFKWRFKNSRHMSKRKQNFLLWCWVPK